MSAHVSDCALFLHPPDMGKTASVRIQIRARCRFKSAWPVSRPMNVLKSALDSRRAYFVKLRFACLRSCLAWRHFVASRHCFRCSLHAQCCNSLRTVGGVMPRTGSRPVYLFAQACLDRLSGISFPWIPQCPGVHTSRTLLYIDNTFRVHTVSATRTQFTFGVISAFCAAWLSEQIATDILFLHCKLQSFAHCSIAYISAWNTEHRHPNG